MENQTPPLQPFVQPVITPPNVEPPKPSRLPFDKKWLFVGIAAFVLVAGSVAAFVVVRQNSAKTAQQEHDDTHPHPNTGAGADIPNGIPAAPATDQPSLETPVSSGTPTGSPTKPSETNNSPSTPSSPPPDSGSTPPAPQPQTYTITYSDSGFSDSTRTIKKGDIVRWVNNSSYSMRVSSDPHPSHTGYPPMNSPSDIANGSTFSFKFEDTGSFGYHNHNFSAHTGTIIVVD